MLADLLADRSAEVCVIDRAQPDGSRYRFAEADIRASSPEVLDALSSADVVVLATPEPVAVDAVPAVAAAMREDALLVETLSVKTPIAAAIGATGVQAVGLNPMFAPSLGMAGRPVGVVVHRDGPLVATLLEIVSDAGGRLVPVDADEHDRLTAAAQVLTHAAVLAFGLALGEFNVDMIKLSSIAPPPHALMLAMLARISSGTPEVYWDIQKTNPSAPQARAALGRAVRLLTEATEDGGAADFAALLQRSRDILGPRLPVYRKLCAQTFDAMPTRNDEQEHDG
jgi:prephenate dehydrogenase